MTTLYSSSNTNSATVTATGTIFVLYLAARTEKAVSNFGLTSSNGTVTVLMACSIACYAYASVQLVKISGVTNPTITLNGGGKDASGCIIYQ